MISIPGFICDRPHRWCFQNCGKSVCYACFWIWHTTTGTVGCIYYRPYSHCSHFRRSSIANASLMSEQLHFTSKKTPMMTAVAGRLDKTSVAMSSSTHQAEVTQIQFSALTWHRSEVLRSVCTLWCHLSLMGYISVCPPPAHLSARVYITTIIIQSWQHGKMSVVDSNNWDCILWKDEEITDWLHMFH